MLLGPVVLVDAEVVRTHVLPVERALVCVPEEAAKEMPFGVAGRTEPLFQRLGGVTAL